MPPWPWVQWKLPPTPKFKRCPPSRWSSFIDLGVVGASSNTQVRGISPMEVQGPLDPGSGGSFPQQPGLRGVQPGGVGSLQHWMQWKIPPTHRFGCCPLGGLDPFNPGCKGSSPQHPCSKDVPPGARVPTTFGMVAASHDTKVRGVSPLEWGVTRTLGAVAAPSETQVQGVIPLGSEHPLDPGCGGGFPQHPG